MWMILMGGLRRKESVEGFDPLPEKGVPGRVHGGPLMAPCECEHQLLDLLFGPRNGSLHLHPGAPLLAGHRSGSLSEARREKIRKRYGRKVSGANDPGNTTLERMVSPVTNPFA